MKQRCGNCYFMSDNECRKAAPRVIPEVWTDSNHDSATAVWPKVEAGQWCGEWRYQEAWQQAAKRGKFAKKGVD